MATLLSASKPFTASPLKLSAPLGAALAFLGMEGCQPLLHGSQGCTAFALVMLVRHFREAIPLQTTAMNEVSTILGGMDNVEQALLTIAKRVKPRLIGLISTALTETRGEDMAGELKIILARNPELAGIRVVLVSAPDYEGSLETGYGKAVLALLEGLLPVEGPAFKDARRVNILPGAHLTPGDIEHLREIVEAFGLSAVVVPDLAASLDGHVPDHYIATTLGGASLDDVAGMGAARLTIAVGAHLRAAAELAQSRTGVPSLLFERLTGLEECDRLMSALSRLSGRPVPARLRRARSQLEDAMLDGHFYFGGSRFAVAGEADFVWAMGGLVASMGGELVAAVTAEARPHLAGLPCERVLVGDYQDLEDAARAAGGVDLVIGGTNARMSCERLGAGHVHAGFPVYDRLGGAHRVSVGYRGTRDLIFRIANRMIERAGHGAAEQDHAAAAAAG
ncbi:nitrogenase molybdenum-iron protein beta chain [mine drainage metagenome]|uniref:Nitrogenase iron-molybdenum cofactor biosynthesis protein NifN n=1 Tax=mine drainage metagenome TaxID=410659 RepID=A0A1J5RFF9_9ZZZZ